MADESDNEDEREGREDDEREDPSDEESSSAADERAEDEDDSDEEEEESSDDEGEDEPAAKDEPARRAPPQDEDEDEEEEEPAAKDRSPDDEDEEPAAKDRSRDEDADERAARRDRAAAKSHDEDHDEGHDDDAGDAGSSGGLLGAGTLGLERYVQFAFVVLTVAIIFVSNKLITMVWGYVATAEPDANIALAAAVILGLVGGFGLYRHKTINPLAHDVAAELAKVTWPTRQETWYSTIVVIVASLIMASYLGAFDALWSAFTDLVYKIDNSAH